MHVRFVVAALAAAGCGFPHAALGTSEPDAGEAIDPTGDGMTIARTCRYPDPDLRLCLEFDDGVLDPVHDSSRYKMDLPATQLLPRNRSTSPAAGFGVSSDLRVPEVGSLDIESRITLEMWVAPGSAQAVPLIINATQYELSIDSSGHISCRMAEASATTTAIARTDMWTHVACTYSGNVLRAYVAGVESDCDYGGELGTGGTTGTLIAPNFAGAIDGLRIYARTLSANEICMHADRTTCVHASTCF